MLPLILDSRTRKLDVVVLFEEAAFGFGINRDYYSWLGN